MVELFVQLAAGERATSGEVAQAVAKQGSDIHQSVLRRRGGRGDSRRWNGDWKDYPDHRGVRLSEPTYERGVRSHHSNTFVYAPMGGRNPNLV
jgi:hypothetical protein